MLAIRMQRTGRKKHAMFRVVVQDSRQAPTSGRVVALLGSYDPHAKTSTLVKDKAELYLSNGAQPSDRVVRLFEAEGVKLPSWVKKSAPKTGVIRNADKLRRNRPAEEAAEEAAPEVSAEVETTADAEVAEAPVVEEAAEEKTEA